MKRLFLALTVAVFLLLVAGVGTAAADPPASQDTGQLAGSDQDATSAAGSAQQGPSNANESVRVLSPGDDGEVTQSNEASSNASAGNVNSAQQNASQDQAGNGGLQAIGQSATNAQDAFALAFTLQQGAENENAPVRDLSEGDGGPVSQSNDASSDANAGNLNAAQQTADQQAGGGQQPTGHVAGDCCSSGGSQVIGQSAENDQEAAALAATVQEKPSNSNVSVRVLSPGDDGPVTQTNDASSNATAGNLNVAEQTATQDQAGGGSQDIGQSADSSQNAAALAATIQEKPSNSNISVRVLSPGDNGPVTQSNEASSNATAGNINATNQTADQSQSGDSCKCGSSGDQVIGQAAKNHQGALAGALTVQHGASNENIDVRVLSPGDGGPVSQSNVASSNAEAGNLNITHQTADQSQSGDSCKCGSSGDQIIGQAAINDQSAAALAATIQAKPSNSNVAVRVLSEGDDGPVNQTNQATSNAHAGNLNATKQNATQDQSGPGLQVIGQAALSEQDAFALGLTFQLGASNENAPVRVLSDGDGGPVSQANIASSDATAGNINYTDQEAAQEQTGSNRCCGGYGIQALGQLALNRQGAVALAGTLQLNASPPCRCGDKASPGNSSTPTRVSSYGDDGPTRQANLADSTAASGNWNAAKQGANQIQAAPCVCKAEDIQALGQLSDSAQFGLALAGTLQLDALGGGHERRSGPRPEGKVMAD